MTTTEVKKPKLLDMKSTLSDEEFTPENFPSFRPLKQTAGIFYSQNRDLSFDEHLKPYNYDYQSPKHANLFFQKGTLNARSVKKNEHSLQSASKGIKRRTKGQLSTEHRWSPSSSNPNEPTISYADACSKPVEKHHQYKRFKFKTALEN